MTVKDVFILILCFEDFAIVLYMFWNWLSGPIFVVTKRDFTIKYLKSDICYKIVLLSNVIFVGLASFVENHDFCILLLEF